MSLTLEDIHFLQSLDGQTILSTFAEDDLSESRTLAIITSLRKTYPLGQASAALTMARLRKKAVDKFPENAHKLFFTEDALQQASDPLIRAYRASKITDQSVLDLCCGIGSDALAYAQAGNRVMAVDIDPVRIAIADHNANVLGLSADFMIADVTQGIEGDFDLIFYDPARRDEKGNRIFDVESYIPPLSLIKNFFAKEILVKLSPAVDIHQLGDYGGQVEFISVNGDLKEALFWATYTKSSPKATLISESGIHHFVHDDELEISISEPRAWLFEPDASILRANLVQDLAAQIGGTMLDKTIAYITSDEKHETVWGRYWQILDWMPFNLKRLRAYLNEHQVRHITVKKRGFPMLPEEIITKLKLKKGDESRVLVFTRYKGDPIVLICASVA